MKQRYARQTVFAGERIRTLMFDDTLNQDETVVYTWDHGHETLERWVDAGGSSHYSGTFHPNDGTCVTGTEGEEGICVYCGMTWY